MITSYLLVIAAAQVWKHNEERENTFLLNRGWVKTTKESYSIELDGV
jgi:hypothetical protein